MSGCSSTCLANPSQCSSTVGFLTVEKKVNNNNNVVKETIAQK